MFIFSCFTVTQLQTTLILSLKFLNIRKITIRPRERVLLHLGCMDFDYAIRKDESLSITTTNTLDVIRLYE